MSTKKPLVNYEGKLKEVSNGDTVLTKEEQYKLQNLEQCLGLLILELSEMGIEIKNTRLLNFLNTL